MSSFPEERQHTIVAKWYSDPRLHAFKDDLGRSAVRHGLTRPETTLDASGFAAKLKLLGDLRVGSPEFFDRHDYGWAFEEGSYLRPGGEDADTAEQSLRHQLIVLRTLVGTWGVLRKTAVGPLDLSGICARSVSSAGLSPTCRLSGGFGYLMVPFGFRRFTLELLIAFGNLVPRSPFDGPAAFDALARPLPAEAFDGFALPFLARAMGMWRSDDMANQRAAEEHLLEEVPAFAGCRIDLGLSAPGTLEVGLHELLLASATNHELGHLLFRHGARRRAFDEGVADSTSLDFSLKDSGWFTHCGASTGLPDPVWFLLGPVLFFWALEVVLRLESLTRGIRHATRDLLHRELADRRSRVEGRLRWLIREVWPTFGVDAPKDALDAIEGFRTNLTAAAASFSERTSLIKAMASAREALGDGPFGGSF